MLRMRRGLRHENTIGLSRPDSPISLCGFVPQITLRCLSTAVVMAGAPDRLARL